MSKAWIVVLAVCVSLVSAQWDKSRPTNPTAVLKSKVAACSGSFLCGITSAFGQCTVDCVSRDSVCDGMRDCANGLDEIGCPSIEDGPCDDGQYTCQDGETCVNPHNLCDGFPDCPDADDETLCPAGCYCPDKHYLCEDSEVCIDVEEVCDGEIQCPYGDDEADCSPTCQCEPRSFICASGDQCIPEDAYCDGVIDCDVTEDDEPGRCMCTCKPESEPDNCAEIPSRAFFGLDNDDLSHVIAFLQSFDFEGCMEVCKMTDRCEALLTYRPRSTRTVRGAEPEPGPLRCLLLDTENVDNFETDFDPNMDPTDEDCELKLYPVTCPV